MSSALYKSIYNEFYNELIYRLTQAEYARQGWSDGSHDSLRSSLITKNCTNPDCKSSFNVLPSDPKKFCSHRCVAHVFNLKRGRFRTTSRCLNCGKLNHRNAFKYCSIFCQNERQYSQFIEKWKIGAVDGNYENNKEENLELLCPNCHALTPNFRGLNRGQGRSWRLARYHRGVSY